MASDYEHSNIISAECKFHNSKINDSDLKKHIEKDLSMLKKKENAAMHYFYFSLNGFTDQALAYAKKNNIRLVSGSQL